MADTVGETSSLMQEEEEEEEERDYSHFFSKPMFEVFHISIHTKEIKHPKTNLFLDGNPCQIYGTVRVVNEDGKKFEFYNRARTNPETLIPGNQISLCAFPIMPCKLLKVEVMLYDVAHDAEIAYGDFQLDYCKTCEYDKVCHEYVQGKYGFASICFSTFMHAIVASVEKVVLQNEAAGSSVNLLSGTVTACLQKKFRRADDNVDDEFPPVMLFRNQQNAQEFTCEQAELNTPIKLFRSSVAVPFFCSLTIEADFLDKTDTRIVMAIQLNVYPARLNEKSVQKQNCEMHVKVTWLDCYHHFPREVKVHGNPHLGEEESQKLSFEAQQSSSCISRRQLRVSEPMAPSFAEVFSLLICAPGDDLVLRGTVEIIDHRVSFRVFDGEQRCCGQKSLLISGLPHSIDADCFGMRVNIKDKKGRVVSQGYFCWNDLCDNSFYQDKRICSIIVGDIGYAAIHYSMFEYSLKAKTRVSFVSKTIPQAFVNVSGSITAEYGNYEYYTPYDQEYYKSILFSRDDYVQVDLILGSTLPLVKSVISVPSDNSLILDVNLRVMGPYVNQGEEERTDDVDKQGQELAVINKLVEFKSNVDGYFIYKGSDYIISVCIEWIVDNTNGITRPILPHKTWLQKVLQKASTTA